MASKESRDAVVSVRISREEQERLKEIAGAQGRSIADLIRGYVARETAEDPPQSTTMNPAPGTGIMPPVGEGIFWNASPDAVVSGATITIDIDQTGSRTG